MIEAVTLLSKLIACPSVTPQDAGCQSIISELLTSANFHCEHMRFKEVDNLWAIYGNEPPLLVFLGHTDVVPTGLLTDWQSPPFVPTVREGYLYGRGASDMKSAVAAMVVAGLKFVADKPRINGSLAFLLTSDEEGPAVHGTQQVVAHLANRGINIDYCIVGEPSSDLEVGDQIRVGRRGSLHGQLTIHGKQGHVAHPHLAQNPIHYSLCILDELAHTKWDDGNEYFPATTFQITNIHSGEGALNVVPGHVVVAFNFRYSTAVSIEQLMAKTEAILNKISLKYDIEWNIGAEPFLTRKGKLISEASACIKSLTGHDVKLSTGGGTSDARFIAPMGAEIIELGVSHRSAHQVNEHVKLTDINKLTELYYALIAKLL